MEQRTPKPRETWEQAVNRLALQAEETGVKIYVYDVDGPAQYFATSVTQPGHLYRVTAISCQCRGFLAHQRCRHHAALLDAIGELPPLPPAPTPTEMVERRAERVQAMSPQHARHIEAQARAWLSSLIAAQDRGESVKQNDIDEATRAVSAYAAIANPPQPVALAA